jgi:hypothetical protein
VFVSRNTKDMPCVGDSYVGCPEYIVLGGEVRVNLGVFWSELGTRVC